MKKPPAVKIDSLLFGNLKSFFSSPLNFLKNSEKSLGDAFRFRAGNRHIYSFSGPEEVRSIFKLSDESLIKERQTRVVLGKSLLTTEGKTWVRQKNYSKKFFSRPNLGRLQLELQSITERSLNSLPAEMSLNDFSAKVIYKLAVKTIFNIEDESEAPNLAPYTKRVTNFVRWRTSQPIKLPLWLPTKKNKEYREAFNIFEAEVKKILHKSEGEKNIISVLKSDPEMTEKELISQAMTFFMSSFETTANALFWTLYLITKNQEYSEKIYEEAMTFDSQKIHSVGDIFSYKMTVAIINESMRLYPPSWFRSRVSQKDCVVNEKYLVPKGVSVWANTYLIHRNPRYWTDPDKFKPERFLDPSYPKECFIPFGGGKNLCIGKDLAYMELVLILLNLFKTKRVIALEDKVIEPEVTVTLNPHDIYKVQFVHRQ